MRTLSLATGVLLATGVATAGPTFGPLPRPGPPIRKPASVSYTADALGEFAEASRADKAGDLGEAETRYRRSLEQDKQANTLYNQADVLRRMERYKDAIEIYGKYLEAAPDASDRGEVEQLIERLRQTPPVVTVDGEDPRAVVFVDGVLAGPSPQTLQLTAGRHTIDRIGPGSFQHDAMMFKPLERRRFQSTARKAAEGNVVLSSSVQRSGGWNDDQRAWRSPERFTLAPGHYETRMFGPNMFCNPIAFDVPKGDGVLFVFVEAAEPGDGEPRPRCLPATVRVKKVSFPP